MARADQSEIAHRELVDACAAMREFAGSGPSLALIRMLDALEKSYVLELREVGESGLVRLQSAIRQAGVIRDVVAGDADVLPKI